MQHRRPRNGGTAEQREEFSPPSLDHLVGSRRAGAPLNHNPITAPSCCSR